MIVEENFNFGCKRVYEIVGENNYIFKGTQGLFKRDKDGHLIATDNERKMIGEYKELDKKGRVKYTCTYVEGKEHGMSKGYYENGQTHWEVEYVNGKREGEFKQYYEDGKLRSRWFYIDGKIEGKYESWDREGNVILNVEYKSDSIFRK